jgi:hypothetical protein
MHPYQQWPRQGDAQPVADQPAERAGRERTDLDALLALDRRRQRRSVPGWADTGDVHGAPGKNEADRFSGQPPGGKRERIVARAVHPLEVVDADQDGPGGSEDPQHVGDREADQAGIRGAPRGVGPAERDLQRTVARGRQVVKYGEHRRHVEQRGEYGERDVALGGAGPPRHQPVAAAGRPVQRV